MNKMHFCIKKSIFFARMILSNQSMKRFIVENRKGSMVKQISGKSFSRHDGRLATNMLFLGPLPSLSALLKSQRYPNI